MKAPDKIYLLKVELEERWPGITEASELEPKKEVCYIRKDALMEWAKENIDSLGMISYGEFIAKLNSM